MFSFTSTMVGASPSYVPYLYGQVQKSDRHKESVLLDFSLAPVNGSFVKLRQGAYISISTATYGLWFTGYIVNDPELTYLGSKAGQPVWGYKYKANSDDYLLNLKPIGVMPPFLNRTEGQILKALVEKLVPGKFDTTGIEDGDLVAQYTPDPEAKFIDVVRDFSESGNKLFYALNHELFYGRQVDESVVIVNKNDDHFTPSRLSLRPSTQPVINDVTVFGPIEPRAYVHEYFVGTGVDAKFPLVSSVFGTDRYVLLDDVFSGSSVDTGKWAEYDTVANYIQLSDGYLNILGGPGTGISSVRLESLNVLPMDGRIRFTHGEWDFLSSTANGSSGRAGVICGCWTSSPSGSIAPCLYGLDVTKPGAIVIRPIVNGAVDSTQSVTIDTTKRYVIRTIAEFTKTDRTSQIYPALNVLGVQFEYEHAPDSDAVVWQTMFTEIDPATGAITNQYSFTSVGTASSAQLAAKYIPFVSDNLHATLSGVTVSVPVAATLETRERVLILDPSFDNWTDEFTPTDWQNPVNAVRDVAYANTGASLKLEVGGSGAGSVEQPVNTLVSINRSYDVNVLLQKSAGATTGTVNVKFVGTGFSDPGLSVAVSSLGTTFSLHTAQIMARRTSIPGDLKLVVSVTGLNSGEAVWVDDVIVFSEWIQKLVGPNEVDAADGLSPAATIVSANTGADTKSSLSGSSQYNPGQAELVFFKDSFTQTSNIPPELELVRLSYRAAGPASGRVQDPVSIADQATKWGDDGIRAVLRSDLKPRPRNSVECELAAAALVKENSYIHYEGSYEQWSDYFTEEPVAGALISLKNLPDLPATQVEEISEVVTTLDCDSPEEHLNHRITFGKGNSRISKFIEQFYEPTQEFQRPAVSSEVGAPIDLADVGSAYAPDVTKPYLVSFDDNYVYMNTGRALTGGGSHFEVRYTDEGWGPEDGKNLVLRTSGTTFQVRRTMRGRVFFIRQINTDGTMSRYPALVHVNFPATATTDTSEIVTEAIPGDVTIIGTPTVTDYVDSNGVHFVKIELTYDPPADIGTFTGVFVNIEAPDTTGTIVPVGSFDYNGDPLGVGAARYGTVQIIAPPPPVNETWRIYLTSYSPTYSKVLVLNGEPNESPNVAVSVLAVAGLIPEPGDVLKTGVTFNGALSLYWSTPDVYGKRQLEGLVQWYPPNPQGSFVGVKAYFYASSAGTQELGNLDYRGVHPAAQTDRLVFPQVTAGDTLTLYLVSRSEAITKALDLGATPQRTVTVPGATVGGYPFEYASAVTSPSVTVNYHTAEDGQKLYSLSGSFVEPSDNRYGGCKIIARPASGNDIPLIDLVKGNTAWATDRWPIQHASETLRIFFVSVDRSGLQNSIDYTVTPHADATITRPTGPLGTEYCAVVDGMSAGWRLHFDDGGNQLYSFYGLVDEPSDIQYTGFRIYARPNTFQITVNVSNGSVVCNRVSGALFSPDMVGKGIDIAGTIRQIGTYVNNNQVLLMTTWSGGGGSYLSTVLMVGDILIADGLKGETSWETDRWPINHQSEGFDIYTVSVGGGGRANTLVPGTTPKVPLTVARSSGSAGKEYADHILTPITLDGGGAIVFNSEIGETQWLASGSFTEPPDPRYGGCSVCRINLADPDKSIEVAFVPKSTSGVGKFRTSIQPTLGLGTMTLLFFSVDTAGRRNSYQTDTPSISFTTPSQTSSLNLGYASPGSLSTAAFASTIRPVALRSSEPALPSTEFPVGSFYKNTTTGAFRVVQPGGSSWGPAVNGTTDIVADSITAASIAAGAISTTELAVIELMVGGGTYTNPFTGQVTTKPPRIRIDDASNNMVGFIGDSGTGFRGGYFSSLRVGTNINSPNLLADNTGVYLFNVPLSGSTLTLDLNGVLSKMNNSFAVDEYYGLSISTSFGVSAVMICPGKLVFRDSVTGGTKIWMHAPNGSNATFGLYNASAQESLRLMARPSGQFPQALVSDGFSSTYTAKGGGGLGIFDQQVTTPAGTKTLRFVAGLLIDVI